MLLTSNKTSGRNDEKKMYSVTPVLAIRSNSWLSDLKLPGLADAVEIGTLWERPCTASRYQTFHWFRYGGNPFFSSPFLRPYRHCLSAALKAEKTDVEKTWKVVPFITCEVSFGEDICEMVLGINIFDLDLWVQVISVEQPIKSNSVGSGNMSHCKTSVFDDHLDHGFTVLKDVQHSSFMGRIRLWGNKTDIRQFKMSLRNWCVGLRIQSVLGCFTMQRVPPCQLVVVFLIRFWVHYINKQSQRWSAGMPSNLHTER